MNEPPTVYPGPRRIPSFWYFTFSGRMARKSYWFGVMAWSALGRALPDVQGFPWEQIMTAVGLVTLAFEMTVVARRLHDVGWSAWWQAPVMAPWLLMVPFGFFASESTIEKLASHPAAFGVLLGLTGFYLGFLLLLGLVPSNKIANRYGPPPEPEYVFRF